MYGYLWGVRYGVRYGVYGYGVYVRQITYLPNVFPRDVFHRIQAGWSNAIRVMYFESLFCALVQTTIKDLCTLSCRKLGLENIMTIVYGP